MTIITTTIKIMSWYSNENDLMNILDEMGRSYLVSETKNACNAQHIHF